MAFFSLFWDLIKSETRNYEILFETFLVIHDGRRAALLDVSKEKKEEIIKFLQSFDLIAFPYPKGENIFVWKKGKYHVENTELARKLFEALKTNPLEFRKITGQLLGYVSPLPIGSGNRVEGYSAALLVSFTLPAGFPQPSSLFTFKHGTVEHVAAAAAAGAAVAPITWTTVNKDTFFVRLMPQVVTDLTEDFIREKYELCAAIFKNSELTSALPVAVKDVHVEIKPYLLEAKRGGKRSRRHRHRKNRRTLRHH